VPRASAQHRIDLRVPGSRAAGRRWPAEDTHNRGRGATALRGRGPL